ncbi:MAG: hypothetical protein D6736_00475 [Nitrospinota bacterium]|nr:MAG: hypothetical protein D6736_00475 [Nitrospinota bacterium]
MRILSGISVVGLLLAIGFGFLTMAGLLDVNTHIGISLVGILIALLTHMLGKEGRDLLAALLLLLVIASGLAAFSGLLSGFAHMVIAILATAGSIWGHTRRFLSLPS